MLKYSFSDAWLILCVPTFAKILFFSKQYRNQLNQQKGEQLQTKRRQLEQRTNELSSIDQRISQLQQRLNRKRALNQQLQTQLQRHAASDLERQSGSDSASGATENSEVTFQNSHSSLQSAALRRSIGFGHVYKLSQMRHQLSQQSTPLSSSTNARTDHPLLPHHLQQQHQSSTKSPTPPQPPSKQSTNNLQSQQNLAAISNNGLLSDRLTNETSYSHQIGLQSDSQQQQQSHSNHNGSAGTCSPDSLFDLGAVGSDAIGSGSNSSESCASSSGCSSSATKNTGDLCSSELTFNEPVSASQNDHQLSIATTTSTTAAVSESQLQATSKYLLLGGLHNLTSPVVKSNQNENDHQTCAISSQCSPLSSSSSSCLSSDFISSPGASSCSPSSHSPTACLTNGTSPSSVQMSATCSASKNSTNHHQNYRYVWLSKIIQILAFLHHLPFLNEVGCPKLLARSSTSAPC